MLTVEVLRQNSVLSGLTDEQLNTIAQMSSNDENNVIGARIGALHGQYDKDILEVTGIEKKQGEKSYDYNKRVLAEYKAKIDGYKGLEAQLKTANAKVTELQGKLEAGAGDEAIKQQLKDAKTQVTQLQAKLTAETAKLTAKEAEYNKALSDAYVDFAFKEATVGLKFKAGITEPIQKTLLSAAKAEVLTKGTPDFVDDGNGGKILILRDKEGKPLLNAKNSLNPYTVKELVMETALKDVIEAEQKQTGGGTGGTGGTGSAGGQGGTLDLSSAKTQVEADNIIARHLMASGLTRDSREFAEQSKALREEGHVAELPIR